MTESLFRQLNDIGCNVLINEPMSEHTSFRIGGPADLIIPNSIEQVAGTISILNEAGSSYFILGRGSNLIVSDDGIEEPVIWISNALSEVDIKDTSIVAMAGARLSFVAESAAKNSLQGLEFAYGIPGSVGGAVVMNAGAYGGEMSQVVEKVTVVNAKGELIVLSNRELDFFLQTQQYL